MFAGQNLYLHPVYLHGLVSYSFGPYTHVTDKRVMISRLTPK